MTLAFHKIQFVAKKQGMLKKVKTIIGSMKVIGSILVFLILSSCFMYEKVLIDSAFQKKIDKKICNYINIDSFEDLVSEINKIESKNKTIVITDAIRIIGNISIPKTITLIFRNGGTLSADDGFTIEINGEIHAGMTQIFSGNGIVKIKGENFEKINAKWWGMSPSAQHTKNTIALQAAINAASDCALYEKPHVFIPSGKYKLAMDGIHLKKFVKLLGNGQMYQDYSFPLLEFSKGKPGNGIKMDRSSSLIGLRIKGKQIQGTPPDGSIGIVSLDGRYINIENCFLENWDTGIYLNKWSNKIYRTRIGNIENGRGNVYKCIHLGTRHPNYNIIRECWTYGCNLTGKEYYNIRIDGGTGIVIKDNIFEPTNYGILINGGKKITIDSNYFELTNKSFIHINYTASSANVSVKDNYMHDYHKNGATSGRSGIHVGAGNVIIANNQIGNYKFKDNLGLQWGIEVRSGVKNVNIGLNSIGCAESQPVNIDTFATAKRITAFSKTYNFEWIDPSEDKTWLFHPTMNESNYKSQIILNECRYIPANRLILNKGGLYPTVEIGYSGSVNNRNYFAKAASFESIEALKESKLNTWVAIEKISKANLIDKKWLTITGNSNGVIGGGPIWMHLSLEEIRWLDMRSRYEQ